MATEHKRRGLYFTVYPHLVRDLGLSGIKRDIFSIIFGFWRKAGKAVPAPFSVLREMTGATDPSISVAIKALRKKKLIAVVDKGRGMRSLYRVTLAPEILQEFEAEYAVTDSDSPPEEEKGANAKEGMPNRLTVPPSESYDISENTIP